LENLSSNPSEFELWIPVSIRVSNLITPTNQMTLIIEVNDTPSRPNITEGGFDYFFISNASTLDLDENKTESMTVYPNPFQESFFIQSTDIIGEYSISTLDGKIVIKGESNQKTQQINTNVLKSGMYILTISGSTKRIIKN
jgi:hypothetical protein